VKGAGESMTRLLKSAPQRIVTGAALTGVIAVAAIAVANGVSSLSGSTPKLTATAAERSNLVLGAYTGPAARGAKALPAWERWSGVKTPYAIDFMAADEWKNITGPEWILAPWRDSHKRLILSLPMFAHRETDKPENMGWALRKCAEGGFDHHWKTLAKNLMEYELEDTIVRPGWEFNGDWYVWSAGNQKKDYRECFRRVVTAMRSTKGDRFQFLWNPSVGTHQFEAEDAYPGDAFVDYVGVDVYDTSWRENTYPFKPWHAMSSREEVSRSVWTDMLDGERGLKYWAAFTAAHRKKMAVPEWGLSTRPDGRGGGDNLIFVRGMLDFVRDPANGVAFAMYFDSDTAASDRHSISSANSPFKKARWKFREMVSGRR
jgi:hypothetical protein